MHVFIDQECPRCGRTCGNGGMGMTLHCSCGWTGGIDPADQAAILDFWERHKARNEKKEGVQMGLEFFLPMNPPTVTHQEKQVRVVNGKPRFYEPQELKNARAILYDHLCHWKPTEPFSGDVRLVCKWLFPRGRHSDGEYRITKPDTDNLQKLIKDCMTQAGFWKDDAQVCSEIVEKFWAEHPGIYVKVEIV